MRPARAARARPLSSRGSAHKTYRPGLRTSHLGRGLLFLGSVHAGEIVALSTVKSLSLALAAAAAALSWGAAAQAQPSGQAVYEARCKSCHEGGVERAPNRADMAQRPAADIAHALTDGIMKP